MTWNRPTNGTRLQKLRVSNCARRIGVSTATFFVPSCPPICTGRTTISTLNRRHVLPALLGKFHTAKQRGHKRVTVWGSGRPRREFLHVDDCAQACVQLMESYDEEEIINIGVGKDISIRELAMLIKSLVGYEGEVVFDTSKPDGTPRKPCRCRQARRARMARKNFTERWHQSGL